MGLLAASASHASGPVVCWGHDSDGRASPPGAVDGTGGTASAIAVGPRPVCAIQAGTGNAVCWGDDSDGQASPPASVNGTSGTASAIAPGVINACAIQAGTGNVVCWGSDLYGQASPPASVDGTSGTASAITAGIYHSCAIQAGTGNVICWGYDFLGAATSPPASVDGTSGTASAITAGSFHSCAIQAGTGNVICWGYDYYGQASPPASVDGTSGTASAITGGRSHSCAIQAGTGNVICWGYETGGLRPPASVNGTSGTASAISAGAYHNCAIQAGTGNAVCWLWGSDPDGRASPPASVDGTTGTASAISAGGVTSCAIRVETAGASLIVEKQTSPDAPPAGNFTFTGDASGTIGDGRQIVVDGLSPGTYTATENDPAPNFNLTDISCTDGNSTGNVGTRTATFNLETDETVICTFTNTDQTGTIIVEKLTDPAVWGNFTFTGDVSGTIQHRGTTKTDQLWAGTYTATENDPAPDFALTGISCDDGNSTGNVGTRTATFNVEASEIVTCTFTNTELGTIIVEKQTSPDAAPGSFTFTGDAPGTIADNGTIAVGGLLPGTYTATENDPTPAFDLTGISCDDGNSTGNVGTRTATFNVEAGETVTCTFTNAELGTIIVEKQTAPDAAPGSFTFTGDAPGTIADNGTIVVGGLLPGTYTATENDPAPGFDLTGISCDDGNSSGNVGTRTATFQVEAGETVTCTFINTDPLGTIIVEKQTNPDAAPGSFTFTGDAAGTIADNGTIVVGGLLPGTYTATENDPTPAFALTNISCNDGNSTGNVGTRTATFQVEAGEVVTCTFTNLEDPGTIIVEKQTSPGGVPGSFTFTGDASGTIGHGQTIVVGGLAPGVYTATENSPAPEFDLTNISCNDGNSSGNVGTRTATFNVEAGETVTCTFTNTDQTGTIIVEKQTDPDAAPGSFTYTGDAAGTIADNGTIVVGGLLPGTYTATENDPAPDFALTSISCNDGNSTGNVGTRTATFNLEAGEVVTCTFANLEDPGTIIVEKQTSPDAAPGSFTFTGDAPGTIADNGTIVMGGLLPGVYTATENNPAPEFNLTNISCNDGNSTGNVGSRTATFNVEAGETVTCTFTNTEQPGTIIVEKQTSPSGLPGSFTFTGDASGTIGHGQTIVVGGLTPGVYTATENDPAPAFNLTSISCDDGDSTGNVGTRTATFQLAPGETVTCTFTNTEQPPLTFGGTVSFGGAPLVVPGPLIAGTHLNGFGAFELEIFDESYVGTGLQDLPRAPTAPLSYVDNQISSGLGESPASVGARWDDSVLADFELLVTGSAMTLGQTDLLPPDTNNGPADLKITLHVPFVSSASQTLDLEASFDITSTTKSVLGASDFVRAEICLYENVGDMLTDASPIPCQAAPKNGSHTVLTNVSSGTTLPHAALGSIPVTVTGGTSYIIIATWEFAVKNQSGAVDLSLSNFELTLGPGTTAVPALPPTGAWVLAAFMILAGALASWRHISRHGRWSLRR